MKAKYTVFIAFFFTLLLFGGGRLLATTDTLWKSYNQPNNFAFSPNDSLFAIFEESAINQRIYIINSLTGHVDTIIKTHASVLSRYITGIFSPDGTKLYCGGKHYIETYNTSNWEKSDFFEHRLIPNVGSDSTDQTLTYPHITKDGKKILSLVDNGLTTYFPLCMIWDVETGKIDTIVKIPYDTVKLQGLTEFDKALFAGEHDEFLLISGRGKIGTPGHYNSYSEIIIIDRAAYTIIKRMQHTRLFSVTYDHTKFAFQDSIGNFSLFDLNSFTYDSIVTGTWDSLRTSSISISYDNRNLAYPASKDGIIIYDIPNKVSVKSITTIPLMYATLPLFSPQNHYLAGFFSGETFMFSTDILSDILKKEDDSPALQIYPNPTENSMSIELNQQIPEKFQIRICNNKGEEIKQLDEKQFDTGNNNFNISTKDLPAGMYILMLKSSTKVYSQKFIVRH